MAEYQHFDGETYITFNIVYATEKEVRLAITNRGKISVLTYDLYTDENGKYFEYGCMSFRPAVIQATTTNRFRPNT